MIGAGLRMLVVGAGIGGLGCPPEVTTWTVLLGRGVTFLAVPIGRGQVYCAFDAPGDSTPRPEGDDVTGGLPSS
jgi:hypothetical protein